MAKAKIKTHIIHDPPVISRASFECGTCGTNHKTPKPKPGRNTSAAICSCGEIFKAIYE